MRGFVRALFNHSVAIAKIITKKIKRKPCEKVRNGKTRFDPNVENETF